MLQPKPGWMMAILLVVAGLAGDTSAAGAEQGHGTVIVARHWHGRTPTAKADEYEKYLASAITKFPSIPGNLGYEMMRETVGEITHFSVISYWESRQAIHAYAGDDIAKTRNLPRDAEYLIEPEPTVRNYDLLVDARKTAAKR